MLTYFMQIAAKFSTGLGRKIEHVKLSEEEQVKKGLSMGLPEQYAKFLAWLEAQTATGAEERSDDSVERVTGRPPQTFDAWVQQNKATWQ